MLKFRDLSQANRMRLPEFKNKKGEPAHSKEDGSDWSPSEWVNATQGELGELASETAFLIVNLTASLGAIGNMTKKLQRGDHTLEELKQRIGGEAADVATYLDLFCQQLGIDLGDVVQAKFNEVSRRVGSSVRLDAFKGAYRINPNPPVFLGAGGHSA